MKYKWNADGVFLCRKVPNPFFQPILYKYYGNRKKKAEVGLLILETYSHIITLGIMIETIICCILKTTLFNAGILFLLWLVSGIFVLIYLILDYKKNKGASK